MAMIDWTLIIGIGILSAISVAQTRRIFQLSLVLNRSNKNLVQGKN
tara:strand:- start:8936 stop:9073 length:138 start_codon:yes stop_codon:yes gene_type:complete